MRMERVVERFGQRRAAKPRGALDVLLMLDPVAGAGHPHLQCLRLHHAALPCWLPDGAGDLLRRRTGDDPQAHRTQDRPVGAR